MKKILFYTINQNIVDQALVSLNSFVLNNSGYDIKLLSFDFSEKNKNHIKSKIGQYFNNVESRFNALMAKQKAEIENERKRLGRKVHDDVNDFYKKNAKKNGFEYKFIPKKG